MHAQDWLYLIITFTTPFLASAVTIRWQSNKDKRDLKVKLFQTIMTSRKAIPITYEMANALNLIDVVFSDTPQVVKRWHDYFDSIQAPVNWSLANRKFLQMISEMAKALGYSQLQQVDIDMFYLPEAQEQWMRVLRNTEYFLVHPKREQSQSPPESPQASSPKSPSA